MHAVHHLAIAFHSASSDPSLVAPDDVNNSPDPWNLTKVLCNPTQGLKVRELFSTIPVALLNRTQLEANGLVTAVFRFENICVPWHPRASLR